MVMTISTKYTRFGISVAAVLTAMVLVTGAIAPVINQAYGITSIGGRATAMSVSSPLGAVNFMDTGPLSSSGGEIDATPTTIQNQVATADGLLSVTMGSAQAESQSAVGELVLLPGNPNQITAYLAMAKSLATCSGVSGSSDITSLTIAGYWTAKPGCKRPRSIDTYHKRTDCYG